MRWCYLPKSFWKDKMRRFCLYDIYKLHTRSVFGYYYQGVENERIILLYRVAVTMIYLLFANCQAYQFLSKLVLMSYHLRGKWCRTRITISDFQSWRRKECLQKVNTLHVYYWHWWPFLTTSDRHGGCTRDDGLFSVVPFLLSSF